MMASRLLQTALARLRKVLFWRRVSPSHWDFFIDAGLRAAEEIRKTLKIDEFGFVHVAGQAHADSRAYFLYAALDEVEKAALHLMQLRDFKVDETPKATGDRITRNVSEFVVEDEGSRERRLLETVLALVLACQANDQIYYRHLLAVEHLHELLQVNMDLYEFHAARSANTTAAIDRQVEECRRSQVGIDWKQVWYLHESGPLPEGEIDEKRLSRLTRPSTFRAKYKLAARTLTDNERLAVGMSYAEAYADPSRAVHFAANNNSALRSPDAAVGGVSRIGLLMMMAIDRCHALLGRPDMELTSQLNRAFERNVYAEERARNLAIGNVEVGDFVLASGYLAEVLEMKDSAYGNRSFRVGYLVERPLPEVLEDWFMARSVRRLFRRVELVEGLEERMGKEDAAKLAQSSWNVVQESLREALVATWKAGLREVIMRPTGSGERKRHQRRGRR